MAAQNGDYVTKRTQRVLVGCYCYTPHYSQRRGKLTLFELKILYILAMKCTYMHTTVELVRTCQEQLFEKTIEKQVSRYINE
jgi:hypothetical protein